MGTRTTAPETGANVQPGTRKDGSVAASMHGAPASVNPPAGRVAEGAAARREAGANQAFIRATRHSGRVRFLKIAMPLAGLVIIAGLILSYVWSALSLPSASIASMAIVEGRMVMSNPEVTGFDSSKRPYKVVAQQAIQDPKEPKKVELSEIDASVPMDEGSFARILAGSGFLDGKAKTLKLGDTIHVKTDDGMTMQLEEAHIDFDKGLLTTERPIAMESARASIAADKLTVEENGRRVIFENRVRMTIHPETDAGATDEKTKP